jgi:hypothetical protein
MMCRHRRAWLDPLWEQFHGLRRPPPATDADAVAVLRECGIEPEVTLWTRPTLPPADPGWITRRLCLPTERTPEVAAALSGLDRPARLATLTWTV